MLISDHVMLNWNIVVVCARQKSKRTSIVITKRIGGTLRRCYDGMSCLKLIELQNGCGKHMC